jgi:hypothetical protein
VEAERTEEKARPVLSTGSNTWLLGAAAPGGGILVLACGGRKGRDLLGPGSREQDNSQARGAEKKKKRRTHLPTFFLRFFEIFRQVRF